MITVEPSAKVPVAIASSVPLGGRAVDAQLVPSLVKTLPAVPGATAATADVPLPISTLLAASVVAPVPPLATPSVPVTPVVRGSPVAFVSVITVGVPRLGAVSAGPSDSTTLPAPVDVVAPVPPLPTGSVPEAVDKFIGGRMLDRVVMLLSGWWHYRPYDIKRISLLRYIAQGLTICSPCSSVCRSVR